MQNIFDDLDEQEPGEHIVLFTGEFPGYQKEQIQGTVQKRAEPYYTLKLIGIDLSPIVTKKRGKRIAIDMDVYFETRVPGKFEDQVLCGKGEAFYFPSDNALYIQDLYIRQAPGRAGKITPIHKHGNTIKLWKAFEQYLKKSFPEAKHITTPLQDLGTTGNFAALLKSLGYTKLNFMLYQKDLYRER